MGNIRIIGPRGSGKTTYLAALAYYPAKQRPGKKTKNIKLQALNDETRGLAEKAENIILEGESLAPTVLEGGIDDLPFYSFGLEVKPFLQKTELINVAVRDYPGEIFEELVDSASANPIHQEFINECLEEGVDGCLILLTDWDKGNDKFISRVLTRFTKLMDISGRSENLRIAVAMSKCERGELWSGRLDPSLDLFQQHLPKTKAILEQTIPPKNLQFYAISTFGVLDRNDPRPNREDVIGTDGTNSILREPEKWRPYGLIEPLYWLSKGKKLGYV
jgi:Double-GTPase 1